MPLLRREQLDLDCSSSWYISCWRMQTLNFNIQEIISAFKKTPISSCLYNCS